VLQLPLDNDIIRTNACHGISVFVVLHRLLRAFDIYLGKLHFGLATTWHQSSVGIRVLSLSQCTYISIPIISRLFMAMTVLLFKDTLSLANLSETMGLSRLGGNISSTSCLIFLDYLHLVLAMLIGNITVVVSVVLLSALCDIGVKRLDTPA
jgi:hypothetical protein